MNEDYAKEQAKMQYNCIEDQVVALNEAVELGNTEEIDERMEAMLSNPLSVLIRSGWHAVGSEDMYTPIEYELLLCTGGPAVRIIGTLDEHNQPETAELQYQDWGTPWTEYTLTKKQTETLIEYAQYFYFEE